MLPTHANVRLTPRGPNHATRLRHTRQNHLSVSAWPIVVVRVEHRLVGIDPAVAVIVLSWFSTAIYIGIGIAPLIGGAALVTASSAVPVAGAAASGLAHVVLLVGIRARRGSGEALPSRQAVR